MSWPLIILLMLAMHVIEDFHLQGRMADMKQRSWWKANAPSRYKDDYIPVILLHGMEWSILVSLPLLAATGLDVGWWFFIMVVANGLVHAGVDHLKCNSFKIGLIADQSIHMAQIVEMTVIATVMA